MNEVEKTPMVSICITTYNHVKYIEKCLDGILMQQVDFPIEILLGEDGSTDGTRELCIHYKNKHPDKIVLFLNDRKNVIYISGHPTGRWNFINLLKNAKGKYIAICEGDDYWTYPLKLQKQVDFLETHPDFVLSTHNALRVFLNSEREPSLYNLPTQTEFPSIEDLCERNFIPTASSVFRNSVIKELPSWYYTAPCGDLTLYFLLIAHGKIRYFNEAMSVYHIHKSGLWSGLSSKKRFIEIEKTFKILNSHFKGKHKKEFNKNLIPVYIELIKWYSNEKSYNSISYAIKNMLYSYIYAIKLLSILKYNPSVISKRNIIKLLLTGK